MVTKIPILYIVVPCYNEELVIRGSAEQLRNKIEALINQKKIATESRILFVDDGSKDNTYQIMTELHKENSLYSVIKLSRNCGQQNAYMAGLSVAYKTADVTITIDVDLQDDINAIDKMLAEYMNGAEIVYGVRSSRKKDTLFKRMTAHAFYKLMIKMGVEVIYDHSEFRLLSKTALRALFEYQESNLFVRGIVPQLGFKTAKVASPRGKRQAGTTKYSPAKLLSVALEGIASFSTKPLSIIFWLGFLLNILGSTGFITTLTLMYTINLHFMWPLLSAMAWLTGIILLALGIIGFYLGKTYIETKHRPRYFIEETLD
ncbi:MAG: glycosyltransferase family 2 protein [Clostridia bacterium]|nr:glycosyltransferase family 2 protein [Clostridia bacterium]